MNKLTTILKTKLNNTKIALKRIINLMFLILARFMEKNIAMSGLKICALTQVVLFAVVILTLSLNGFPPEVTLEQAVLVEKAGFFQGFAHGYVMVLTYILSLFFDITFYALSNTGQGYNGGFILGFMLMIILGRLQKRLGK
jgi:hypothetical protein